MKVGTDKCEVSCIRRKNFTLLAHVAGCEINCSGKKPNLSWRHYGYIIENICSLYSSGQKRKEISSPSQMISGFSGALGWIVFGGPSFHLSMHVWTQLTDNRWHELAAQNPVAFPAHFCVSCRSNSLCYVTESLKASIQEKMMMKIQNYLKTNRKQHLIFSMTIETAALLFLRQTSFSWGNWGTVGGSRTI